MYHMFSVICVSTYVNISVYGRYVYVGTVHLCACMYMFVCAYECLYMGVSECSHASDYVLFA